MQVARMNLDDGHWYMHKPHIIEWVIAESGDSFLLTIFLTEGREHSYMFSDRNAAQAYVDQVLVKE